MPSSRHRHQSSLLRQQPAGSSKRLAGGEIGGLPRLPKRSCDAFRQAMARFLAQFVRGDEDENAMWDTLPFLLFLAGFFRRVRLFCLLNVTGDTTASSLGLSHARWHADGLRHRAAAALMKSNCARHPPIDYGAQHVAGNLNRQRVRLFGCTRIELIN